MSPSLPRPTRRLRRTLAGAALAPLLLLPLAGCGGSSDGSGGSADQAGGTSLAEADPGTAAPSNAPDVVAGKADAQAEGGGGTGQRDDPVVAISPRAVVSTGSVRLASKDVGEVRSRVGALLTTYGGYVADEDTSTDPQGRPSSTTLTLRVPAARFDAAMKALAGLGRLRDATRSAEDVTTEVIDVDQRIRAQQVGLRRLEQLMQRSSSLGNLLQVEREVTARQATLDSLTSRQAYLRSQTSLATITLSVKHPDAKHVAPHRDAGFLAGLEDGWQALLTVLGGLLRGAGAVLPFAAVALVLWLPVRLLVRRIRRTRAAAPAT